MTFCSSGKIGTMSRPKSQQTPLPFSVHQNHSFVKTRTLSSPCIFLLLFLLSFGIMFESNGNCNVSMFALANDSTCNNYYYNGINYGSSVRLPKSCSFDGGNSFQNHENTKKESKDNNDASASAVVANKHTKIGEIATENNQRSRFIMKNQQLQLRMKPLFVSTEQRSNNILSKFRSTKTVVAGASLQERYGRIFDQRGGEVFTLRKSRIANLQDKQQLKSSKHWFPIQRNELPRFVFMSSMMFLFIYVYTTVRDTKDTLVVSNCGAESIPFLKMYGVMPAAFLFLLGYTKASQFLDKVPLFYATLLPFFGFYTLFAFYLYPNRKLLHFGTAVGTTTTTGPAMKLIQNWSFSLYFIVSELWASAGVPLLFWQVANDITSIDEAKRFYPLFAVFGNLAPIASGKVMKYIVSTKQPTDDSEGFGVTLKYLSIIKVLSGVAIILLYNLVYGSTSVAGTDDVTPTRNLKKEKINSKSETKKEKVTLRESIGELSKSIELKNMAIMVLGYNVCVELTEVLWKGILRKTYPTESAYMSFMASFSQRVGTIALILQLSASYIIQFLGWTKASRLTPILMFSLAIPFYMSVALSKKYPETIPLTTALTVGTWQNIVNKIGKYSLFDPLKEMAYIPLGPDAKTKGKAAIEVLGARLGRSLAAGSQQLIVIFASSGSILDCAPYLGAMYTGIIVLWLRAINVLGKLFETTNNAKNEQSKKR